MFSTTQTPSRPRPPSQLRRSANNTDNNPTAKAGPSHSPPPPYRISPNPVVPDSVPVPPPGLHRRNLSVCSMSSIANMDSSVAATAQLLGLELSSRAQETPVDDAETERERQKDEAYVREKSREELEKLLLKAEAVIRARERELGVAAAVGKQLLETNLSLRQRHASLVSKTSSIPPSPSPLTIGTTTSMDTFSPPVTPIASPSVQQRTPVPIPNTGPSPRHSRRISTTPAQLALLHKQNEELLSALANLKDDTVAADMEGKQKLRKLEKEIAGLRSELESTHQKNTELETKLDTVQAVQENQRNRSRSTGTSGSGSRTKGSEDEGPSEVVVSFPNFAPLSKAPLKRVPRKAGDDDKGNAPTSTGSNLIAFPSSDPPETREPSAEYVLLSKLLSKIEELENTNRQILARHRETDSRLRNATNKSDALQKMYTTLEDEIENDNGGHIDAEDEFEGGVLRVSPEWPSQQDYFRDSRESQPSGMRGLGVLLEPGGEASPEPSLRDRGSPVPSIHREDSGLIPMVSSPNSIRSKRSRKALSPHLFESAEEGALSSPNLRINDPSHHRELEEEPPLDGVFPTRRRGTSAGPAILRPKAFANPMSSTKRKLRPKASLGARLVPSRRANFSPKRAMRATASYQGLRDQPKQEDAAGSMPRGGETLWNELKALADDEFINSYDVEGVDQAIDSILHEHDLPRDHRSTSRKGEHDAEDDDEDTRHIRRHQSEERERENAAVTAIREALDPRNAGRPLNDDEHILPVGSLEGSPGESFFLLSRAVAARPTRWTTARPSKTSYLDAAARHRMRINSPGEKRNTRADSLYGVDGSGAATMRRAVALSRLNATAEGRTTPGTQGRANRSGRRRGEATNDDAEDGSLVVRGNNKRDEPAVAKDGWGQTLLELWVILQAAIILVVFVYSMARKGPRAILDAAEVRRRPN